MSKWIIDINDRWLIHDVFEREEPDDDFIEKYFNSIYGVKSVEKVIEEKSNVTLRLADVLNAGDVFQTMATAQLVIITSKKDGYIYWLHEDGTTGKISLNKSDNDLRVVFYHYVENRSISDFWENIKTIKEGIESRSFWLCH